MELTPGLQRLVFVVIVVALVALGIYVIHARDDHGTPAAAASSSAAASASTGSANTADSASSAPPTAAPSAAAPPAGSASASDGQIYQWLPFTAADLASAANTTTAFAKAYATWDYTETAQAYAATFTKLVTPTEINTIESGYATNSQRTTDKQTSTGSGTIDSISLFSSNPTSITFLVTIAQQVTPAASAASNSQQYEVTVVPSAVPSTSGATWQVNDIELPNTGNGNA